MEPIEGFRVRNYKALRDITLGKLSTDQKGDPLTPFTVSHYTQVKTYQPAIAYVSVSC
ncbi:hypothetical protein [Delftia sp. PS-11]|uniref:hypothetical protein n=1 Tax=Delftia sp. PS-11 TaxID=2767222 RepID=UPI0024551610|nr:hypothetical protein [Delftia sp. PS-11]KAJ8743505.1 hypothetical protein H9T68_17630 [Delftia sp. PS-11]